MAREFISCDWGTSSFRMHLIGERDDRPLASVCDGEGIGSVHREWLQRRATGVDREQFYFVALRAQMDRLGAWASRSLQGLPLVISGMASASIGLREVAHVEMPFFLDGRDLRIERLNGVAGNTAPVLLISGARTSNDMMRGEEIQVVGAAALGATREALYILPGTHSKHVSVERTRATELRTYMTGEFFDLLTRHSILVNSVDQCATTNGDESNAAFSQGVAAGVAENLLHASFGVRVAELSGARNRADSYRYLSGLVIGAELRELRALPARPVVLVGGVALTNLYARALRILGHTAPVTLIDAERAVIAGQRIVAERAGLLAARPPSFNERHVS